MPVYFIRAGDDGPVKIGWSVKPEERVSELQTGHYEALSIIRVVDGARRVEAAFHKLFSGQRLRGEWFLYDVRMMNADASHLVAPDEKKPSLEPVDPVAMIEAIRANRSASLPLDPDQIEWLSAERGMSMRPVLWRKSLWRVLAIFCFFLYVIPIGGRPAWGEITLIDKSWKHEPLECEAAASDDPVYVGVAQPPMDKESLVPSERGIAHRDWVDRMRRLVSFVGLQTSESKNRFIRPALWDQHFSDFGSGGNLYCSCEGIGCALILAFIYVTKVSGYGTT